MTVTDAQIFADLPNGIDDTSALQVVFDAVDATGKIGVIPPGAYSITQPLSLPRRGNIYGSNRQSTVIHAVGDIDILQVKPNTDWLDVGHLGLSAGKAHISKAGIRILSELGDVKNCIFHDILMNGVYAGVHSEPIVNKLHGMLGVEFHRVLVRSRGYAMSLRNTTACKLLYFSSDHVNLNQAPREIRDIWIEGNTQAGGGCYLDHVNSQFPGPNGVVIENFVQLWARHVTGDNALERCIWIKNCVQIHLVQAFASLGGRSRTAGFSMVVERDTLGDTNITLDQCHVGGAQVNAGLLLKNVRGVSVTNGTFIENAGASIKLEHCENVSIVGALIRGIPGSVHGIELVNSKFGSLVGNQILGFAEDGIRIEGCQSIVVTGNVIFGPGRLPFGDTKRGISIINSSFCSISGNSVREFQKGIKEFGTSDHNVIDGNIVAFNGGGPADGAIRTGAHSIESDDVG
jgi:Periplasmic copper-binding protein (NosD)